MSETNDRVEIKLKGRIDSGNAAAIETEIQQKLSGKENVPVLFDMTDLEYISSAGLRILLRVKKSFPDLTITNASSEVYEILEMTGFTEMMKVEKAYRVMSVEGCEVIGIGANGIVYRVDQDTVVKAYKNADALEDIQHEREVARLALILGIPTAISYDVVRVGDSYGSVFELLNARPFSSILAEHPEKIDWCAKEYVDLLKKIHGTLVPEGKLPDLKDTVIGWAEFMQEYLPKDKGEKLLSMIKAVPHDDHMVHGDYHTKNVMLQGDEVLLIDMDTLAVGHPIFELASVFNSLQGYAELDHSLLKSFQGYDYEIGREFLTKVLSLYLGTTNPKKIQEVEDKARIVGYTRMIRRSIRRKGLETEQGRAEIAFWKERLLKLLDEYDTLLFTPDELVLDAVEENLPLLQEFIEKHLEETNCPAKAKMQIELASEEIFVNIVNYAYAPEKGTATVRVEVSDDPVCVTITFLDRGVPYDPLAKEDPDVTLSAEDREIGGLGIFLTKKTMDDVSYEYKDGQNILTLKKNL